MKYSSIMSRLVILAGLFILAGALWILSSTQRAEAQPPIPHTLVDREDCLSCHAAEGSRGIPQMPSDHHWHTSNSCQKCHDPLARYAPQIPHTLEGRENCLGCHQVQTADEGFAAQSLTSMQAVPTPVAYVPLSGEVDNCVTCHLSEATGDEQMVTAWQSSIHAERGVSCASCHGGDPNAEDMASAKSPETGYIGIPDRTDIPDLCGSCHASVTQMRQYGVATDQLAQYRESVHGQQLAAGDTKVATCYDCHDNHSTHETNDPRSSVYRFNVPTLCASCHADPEYMADYDIPTDQYDQYAASVHGVDLLENQDIRAPNCATCHGTHGAAPPGFSEIANVCGSCHTATQDYYASGVHSSENPDSPQCVTCHGRHDVQEATEELYVGAGPQHCEACHAPETEEASTVTEIYQLLAEANQAYTEAQDGVEHASALGMIVTDEENLLTEAYTKLIITRAAQHTVNRDVVQEQSSASVELSQEAHQLAEDAIGESRFRRRAMVVAVVVIGIVIFSLVLLRRELNAQKH